MQVIMNWSDQRIKPAACEIVMRCCPMLMIIAVKSHWFIFCQHLRLIPALLVSYRLLFLALIICYFQASDLLCHFGGEWSPSAQTPNQPASLSWRHCWETTNSPELWLSPAVLAVQIFFEPHCQLLKPQNDKNSVIKRSKLTFSEFEVDFSSWTHTPLQSLLWTLSTMTVATTTEWNGLEP